jgi:hypothetical protein
MNQNLLSIDQRTPEWYQARSGKFTGSRFKDLLTRDVDGKHPKAYSNLIWQMVVERLTGEFEDTGVDSASLRWGREHEEEARKFYQFETGETVTEAGFILHPTYKNFVGVSPDGRVGRNGGTEFKCPKKSEIHLSRFQTGITDEFIPQVQGCIWVCEADWWDWISYDPRMPIHLRMFRQRIYRDDAYIKQLERTVLLAEGEVRETLKQYSAENIGNLLQKFNHEERIAA